MGERGIPVTPLDQFKGWRRDGERRLAELTSYRESAQQRFEEARAELAAIDGAIGELSTLLQGASADAQTAQVRIGQLTELLMRAMGDFSVSHPLYEEIAVALDMRQT